MKKKKYRVDTDIDIVSIAYVVNEYLGVNHSCNNLRHCGLKQLNSPFIIGVANDIAYRNIDLVRDKEIIIVRDTKGDLGSYINPTLIKSLMRIYEIEDMMRKLEKTRVVGLENLEQFYQNVTKKLQLLYEEKDLLEKMYGHQDIITLLDKGEIIRDLYEQIKRSGEIDERPKLKRKTVYSTNETSHDKIFL